MKGVRHLPDKHYRSFFYSRRFSFELVAADPHEYCIGMLHTAGGSITNPLVQVGVANAGHLLQRDAPDIVIESIKMLIEVVRRKLYE
ncbi:MAG TPA: hypothetical protein VFZ47_09950 [Chitinophagaceae bacterium]